MGVTFKVTRALLDAALNRGLDAAPMRTDANFGFEVPVRASAIDPGILDPRETWADKRAYDTQARRLVQMFIANFGKFENDVGAEVKAAAPACRAAAE